VYKEEIRLMASQEETHTKVPMSFFYVYVYQDKAMRDELDRYLAVMKMDGVIAKWYSLEISPGEDWEQEMKLLLFNSADVILLLVSPDFIASDQGFSVGVRRAIERHERGEARVVPVILRPVVWESMPFGKLEVLPIDGKPITMWADQVEAFLHVAVGVLRVVTELVNRKVPKTKEEWVLEGKGHYDGQRYEEALAAYKNALELDGEDGLVRETVGRISIELGRYEEALGVYEGILETAPSASAYLFKGLALQRVGRSLEALEAYQKARELGYSG
jgi:tetratricopeptide (TPR) repeat protein